MRDVRIRLLLAALVLALGLAPAPAQAQNKCESGKLKCVNKYASCLLKVHEKALKKGELPDGEKLQKCIDKFTDAEKGCVAKIEGKQQFLEKPETVCVVSGNTSEMGGRVDDCVSTYLGVVDSGGTPNPTPTPTPGGGGGAQKCESGKLKCVNKYTSCLLKVFEKAFKKGEPIDGEKLQKCIGKFTDAEKGCVAKVEGKQKPDKPESICSALGNTSYMGDAVDDCTLWLFDGIDQGGVPNPTPVPTPSGLACGDPGDSQCGGTCPAPGSCYVDAFLECSCTQSECEAGSGVSCVGDCAASGGACGCSGGICFNPAFPCESSADCPPGYVCLLPEDGFAGYCGGGSCFTSVDCPAGDICSCVNGIFGGTCICMP